MSRQARFIIETIAELHRQIRYAPPTTRLRQMNAAETLAGEIDPERSYPVEYIIYRITGYRPDSADASTALVGDALRRDLANFIQRLSGDLDLSPAHADRRAIPLDGVAAHLGVSPRTVQRYRQQGLICHAVHFPDGAKRLACFEDALERFIASNNDRLKQAATFSRVDEPVQQRVIALAESMRREHGHSLNEASKHIASRIGRAHETVRNMLQRHDRRAEEPIFAERGPLTDSEIRLIHRAWKFGVPLRTLTERFQRTGQTIHRAVNRMRAHLVESWPIDSISLPTFEREGVDAILLGHPRVRSDLWESDQALRDPLTLIRNARVADDPIRREDELAIVAGYNFLKSRAANQRRSLGRAPGARLLDGIETDLRWAGLLKARLIALGFPGALKAIEQHSGRALDTQPGGAILELILLGHSVISKTIDTLDPSREQRITRRVRYAMDLALAQRHGTHVDTRAAARHAAGSLRLLNPIEWHIPWWRWLMPRRDLPTFLERLGDDAQRAIAARYGWDGTRPHTVLDLAQRFAMTETAMTRLLDRAESELRAAAREQP